jgi:prepilin-type N-terminal cleavage/methylation domain-containing protein
MSPSDSRGFTLIEIMLVVFVIGTTLAIAVPAVSEAMRIYGLNNARQSIVSAVRSARYTAVSKNKTVRIRFNCPTVNEFRIIEVVGSGVDSASNRCQTAAYPYPDKDVAAAPNVDGPVMRLPQRTTFGSFQDIEIDTNGRMTPLTGCPPCTPATGSATIVVKNGTATRQIVITANGQVSVN